MQNLTDKMKQMGATVTTVNLLFIMLMIFMFLLGAGLFYIILYDSTVAQTAPSPFIITTFSLVVGAVITVISASHATSTLVTNQSQTVHEQQALSSPIVKAAADVTLLNAQTMQQVLTAMAVVNQTQATSIASTATAAEVAPAPAPVSSDVLATQENTAATQENTAVVASTLPASVPMRYSATITKPNG